MKHTMILTAATVFAALGLAAADTVLEPNLPDPDEPVEIRVTSGDANKEIKAKVGEIIVIEVEGNATTGYSWDEMPGRSDSVLESQGHEYKMQDFPVGMVGVGGKAVFRYRVKAPGKTEIVLGYARPWEKDKPPEQMFNVKIVAEAVPASAAPADAKPAGKTVELGRDDDGKTVTVRPGDVVCVKLRSNRTTGYSWAEVKGKTDAKVLKSDGGEYKVDEHPAGMVGVGGNEVWTFTALAAGRTEIVLGYARPWEKDKEPAQTFKVTVVVDGAVAPAQAGETKDAGPAKEAKEFTLGDKDSGKTLEVRVGDSVKLVLETNPTTGFSWNKIEDVDKSILKLEKNDYRQNANPGRMVGVGGNTTIVYRAIKAGSAKIDLVDMQPWEPDSEFKTEYSVTVKVLP